MTAAANTLMPKSHEILDALHEFSAALFFTFDNPRFWTCGCDVGPSRQFAAVLKREVEKSGEHHCGELDRHFVDPIKLLVNRDTIEDVLCSLADQL